MSTALAVFTRDLRISDNPVLAAAALEAEHVVPLFIVDDRIARTEFSNQARQRFLTEGLTDLDRSLRRLGGRLVLRHGDAIEQICRVAEQVNAARVHIAADASWYARQRETALRSALARQRRELRRHEDVHTVVAAGRITPNGKDHYAVFSPYYRAWRQAAWRPPIPAPDRICLPDIAYGNLPPPESGGARHPGGETAARHRADRWLDDEMPHYQHNRDLLAVHGTSRLSPYLHLGCISATELAHRAGPSSAAQAFVRQLAWRDFNHQVLAARPDAAHRDYRGRNDNWRDDPGALHAWRDGHTGIPIVDAGMRQLLTEGWMHNRARLIAASFLTRTCNLDWRAGAAHFFQYLLDGDIANNCLNWQWVAGTGTNTRPNQAINPIRQATRFDPDGSYVRRYVPELADLNADDIHQPWRLPAHVRRALHYPQPIIGLPPDSYRGGRYARGSRVPRSPGATR